MNIILKTLNAEQQEGIRNASSACSVFSPKVGDMGM